MAHLQTEMEGNQVQITVVGDVDAASIDQFSHALLDVAKHRPKVVTVNAEKLDFIYSDGLAVFIELAARLKRTGGKLRIQRPSSHLRELLAATRLDMLLPIVEVDARA